MTPHEPDCLCTLCAREMREEIARLKARIKAWENEDEHEAMDCYIKREQLDAATAEVKRLRGALEWYAHGCSTYDDGKAAREALSQKGAV